MLLCLSISENCENSRKCFFLVPLSSIHPFTPTAIVPFLRKLLPTHTHTHSTPVHTNTQKQKHTPSQPCTQTHTRTVNLCGVSNSICLSALSLILFSSSLSRSLFFYNSSHTEPLLPYSSSSSHPSPPLSSSLISLPSVALFVYFPIFLFFYIISSLL